MEHSSRRDMLRQAAVLPWLAAAAGAAEPSAPSPASPPPSSSSPPGAPGPALDYRHAPRPLRFRPGALAGLSERLVQSHWENNYGGAVQALNAVRGRLRAGLADRDLPPYLYNELKREQLLRTGSVVLHELYFDNLGGDGRADAGSRMRLAAAFGSFDAWESEFRRIALGLGGGSGWVVLGHNPVLDVLENYWLADHATAPAAVTPVLVLDMYEHAYHMDHGAAAARYVDAFFANLQWEAVARRLQALEAHRGAGRPGTAALDGGLSAAG